MPQRNPPKRAIRFAACSFSDLLFLLCSALPRQLSLFCERVCKAGLYSTAKDIWEQGCGMFDHVSRENATYLSSQICLVALARFSGVRVRFGICLAGCVC
jgi:hypothetical protein